jgi:triosephosphate isomerase
MTNKARRPLLAGNWKMNGLGPQGVALAERVAEGTREMVSAGLVDVVICPPFTLLGEVGRVLAGTGLALGAQNVHGDDRGAFTGEISAPMLVSAGCRYVITGHSERRQYFAETDETVRLRLGAALRHGLHPILCVGETWQERQDGRTEERIGQQLRGGLGDLATAAAFSVAYEPVWAIGSGRAAGGEDAQEVAAFIRRLLGELVGSAVAGATRILYGGSVKPENMSEFAGQPDVDGALVGGAALEAETFAAIVRQALR